MGTKVLKSTKSAGPLAVWRRLFSLGVQPIHDKFLHGLDGIIELLPVLRLPRFDLAHLAADELKKRRFSMQALHAQEWNRSHPGNHE